MTVASCGGIPYNDDVGAQASAQANSHEVPVRVQGEVCRDLKKKPGACMVQIKSDEAVRVRIDPMDYSYRLLITCTTGMDVPASVSVAANQVYTLTIEPKVFQDFRTFSCIGEISPDDRPQQLSGKWRMSAIVVDASYQKMDGMYVGNQDNKNYLVNGENCRTAWILMDGKWTRYSKTTAVEIKGPLEGVRGYCESMAMRYTSYRLAPQDDSDE